MPSLIKPAVHFVGFRGDEYHSAVRIWGKPRFIHMGNDTRMRREMADGDTVIYGNGCETRPTHRNYSDPMPSDPENCV
jgi:hypothetical protein